MKLIFTSSEVKNILGNHALALVTNVYDSPSVIGAFITGGENGDPDTLQFGIEIAYKQKHLFDSQVQPIDRLIDAVKNRFVVGDTIPRKIEAIKFVRSVTNNVSLKEAKDFVEAVAKRGLHPEKCFSSGCTVDVQKLVYLYK
jgi:hypothetical protein